MSADGTTPYGSGAGGAATAVAHPNIALSKYWGKASVEHNLPAVPSLSLTLAGLCTTTSVRFDESLRQDQFALDGEPATVQATGRVSRLLDLVWSDRPFAHVSSHNDFPTASGLASSASAFAALAVAADAAAGGRHTRAQLSDLARRISASAGRSLFGGFVELPAASPEQSSLSANPFKPATHWPLRVVVAVTTDQAKAVGSTQGMLRSAQTSPLYDSWLRAAPELHQRIRQAVDQRDFDGLGRCAEQSALTMHGVAMASDPGLLYWNDVSVRVMARVRALRREGLGAYFTIDAGPHVKVLCLPEQSSDVQQQLARVPGVVRLIAASVGRGARLLSEQGAD